MVHVVKNLMVRWGSSDGKEMQETWVWFLDWEDPLETEVATHSCILAGEFHGQKNLVGSSPWGCRVRHDWMTNTFTSFRAMRAMFPRGSSVFIVPSEIQIGNRKMVMWQIPVGGWLSRELMGSPVEGGGFGIQTGRGGLWEPKAGKGAGVSS